MTLQQMLSEVDENCRLADVSAPGAKRALSLLNGAKDRIATRMLSRSSSLLVGRATFTVAAGDASIALPSDFLQLIGLTRTDTSTPFEVTIIDTLQREQVLGVSVFPERTTDDPYVPLTMYMEGNAIYFVRTGGAPSAMTLLMRYRQHPADLTEANLATRFTQFPLWVDRWLIDQATLSQIPAQNPNYDKYAQSIQSYDQALEQNMHRREDNRVRNIADNMFPTGGRSPFSHF